MARIRNVPFASIPLLIVLGLASEVATASPASTPPNEVVLHTGYDANGGSWLVQAGRDRPLVVSGPRTFTLALPSPLDYLSLRTALDGNMLWIADGSPRVVWVALTNGSTREAKLPLTRISHLEARGGLLFAGSTEGGAPTVLRFDPATGKSERLFDTRLPGTFLTVSAGASRVWTATWMGLGTPQVRLDLIGTPFGKVSSEAPRRATREAAWASERWPGFAVHEDDDGNVWLAHTYAGQVARLDPSGAWTSWRVAPERLVSLTSLGSRAVALFATMDPPDPLAPPGIARGIRSQSLVVIDPSSKDVKRTDLPPQQRVESLARAGARVWIAQGSEVTIVGGRAVVSGPK